MSNPNLVQHPQNVGAELAVIRQRQDATDQAIAKLTHAVDHLAQAITKSNSKDQDAHGDTRRTIAEMQAQIAANAARPITWQMIAFGSSLMVTLASYFTWWSNVTSQPTRDAVMRIERQVEASDLKVMRWQVDQLLKERK